MDIFEQQTLIFLLMIKIIYSKGVKSNQIQLVRQLSNTLLND